MDLEILGNVRDVLLSSGWNTNRSLPLFGYQQIDEKSDKRAVTLTALNGLVVYPSTDLTVSFFMPPMQAEDPNGRSIEDLYLRDLEEIQEIEGIWISDPVHLCHVEDRFSPYDVVIDEFGQLFGVGEMIVYLGDTLQHALNTILFDFSSARYIAQDGSLTDLQNNKVHGSVKLNLKLSGN